MADIEASLNICSRKFELVANDQIFPFVYINIYSLKIYFSMLDLDAQ